MRTLATPGVSVAVIDGGAIAWAKGWGVRDAGYGDPITTDTLFQAASISKPVTATAVLRLVDQGRLNLDEDVNNYLTSWQVPANDGWQPRVTLRQLLSHTGGTTVHGFPGYSPNRHLPTAVQVLRGEQPANTPPVIVDVLPGTVNRYSGGGTTIVQQVLMDVLNLPFPQIMREWALDPLGMDRSAYEQPLSPERWNEAATAHQSGGTPQPGRWHIYPEMAAAGLWTTPSDLARFAIALQKAGADAPDALLSPTIIEQMMTSQLGDGYGLGLALSGPEGSKRFGHGGSNMGFLCNLEAYQHRGLGAVMMINSQDGWPLFGEIFNTIAQEYGWPDYLKMERVEAEVNGADCDVYAGEYELPSTQILTVVRAKDGLLLHFPTQPPVALYPESGGKFFARVLNIETVFNRDEENRVTGLTLRQSGHELTAKRKGQGDAS